jgi:hypothetical protein
LSAADSFSTRCDIWIVWPSWLASTAASKRSERPFPAQTLRFQDGLVGFGDQLWHRRIMPVIPVLRAITG